MRSDQPGLADPNRPVWILENGFPKVRQARRVQRPSSTTRRRGGAEAAQTDTFSFGPLDPGDSRDIVWRVTPVEAGTYTVHYELAAGLNGKAKAVTDDGGPVEGEFVVTISDKPPQARVDDDGNVVISRSESRRQRASNVPAVRVRRSIGVGLAALWLGACASRLRRRRRRRPRLDGRRRRPRPRPAPGAAAVRRRRAASATATAA